MTGTFVLTWLRTFHTLNTPLRDMCMSRALAHW